VSGLHQIKRVRNRVTKHISRKELSCYSLASSEAFLNFMSPLRFSALVLLSLQLGCGATPGPDKAISGAILGAGWGAGAGAIMGNQLNTTGPGAAVGAGIGATAGLLAGAGLDIEESSQLQTRRELNRLRARAAMNEDHLIGIREELNGGGRVISMAPSSLTLYFDPSLAALRTGSAKELERLADSIKRDPLIRKIEIFGHSDDTGSKEDNEKISLARARTVQGLLIAHGLSSDLIKASGLSTTEPKASNRTEAGRQLNRRVDVVVTR